MQFPLSNFIVKAIVMKHYRYSKKESYPNIAKGFTDRLPEILVDIIKFYNLTLIIFTYIINFVLVLKFGFGFGFVLEFVLEFGLDYFPSSQVKT